MLRRVTRTQTVAEPHGHPFALVFLEILPELAAAQEAVGRTLDPESFLDRHVYIVAVVGLAMFYGMDRLIRVSRQQHRSTGAGDHTSDGVFYLSMAVVGTKNLTVGFLLAEEPRAVSPLVLLTLALALEFTVADRGMHADHQAKYDRIGRWVLTVVLCFGWIAGFAGLVPEISIAILRALLAGMIVLNVFKEELPEERQSSYSAFLTGLVLYGGLLLLR